MPAASRNRIQLNLGRSHGLDLDYLSCFFLAQQIKNDLARLGRIRSPMNRASGGSAAGFKLFEIKVEIIECVSTNGRGRRTQFLPVGFFGYALAALVLDDVDSVGHVLAQLRITQHRQRGLWKWRRQRGVKHGMG